MKTDLEIHFNLIRWRATQNFRRVVVGVAILVGIMCAVSAIYSVL